MCKRLTLGSAWSEIQGMYRLGDAIAFDALEHSDCVPNDKLFFIADDDDGRHQLREGTWGLVPWKVRTIPERVIFNARIEVVDTSSFFKDAWASKRCIIPTDGFYVTGPDGNSWFVRRPDKQPFSIAGLWAFNRKLGITSCTLITTTSTAPVSQVNKTQPLILAPNTYDAWLNPGTPIKDLNHLLDRNEGVNLELHHPAPDPVELRETTRNEDKLAFSGRVGRRSDSTSHSRHRSANLGPNEVLIEPQDRLLAKRSGILQFWCEHEGCNNGAFWSYSQGEQGPQSWFCNDHRAYGEALLSGKQPATVARQRQMHNMTNPGVRHTT